ncbi:MAG: tetratricopeptide repeat protein [Rhizobiales bacterium]|nr:tetratricopeptide repeat protein [Hyphomicrobiales bacterium]
MNQRSARDGAGLRPWLVRLAAVLAIACVHAGGAKAEDPVKGEVKVFTDGGFARLVFRLDQEVEAKVEVSGAIMVINFKKPVAIAVDRLNVNARDYISAARRDPDGAAIRLALARKVKVNTITAAEQFFVDLLPENWKGLLPGLPQEVVDELARRAREAERQLHQQRAAAKQKKPAAIRVKVAAQPTFTRYVFEMPETANVVPEQVDGKLTLNFDQQIKWDLADAKAALPPTLESIDADIDFDSVIVSFTLNGSPTVRTFREDRSIVVDISLDGAKTKPAAVPVAEKIVSAPTIEAPQTIPATPAVALEQPPKPAAPLPPPKAAETPAPLKAAENPAPVSPKVAENPLPALPPPKKVENPAPAQAAATPITPKEPAKSNAAEAVRPAPNPNAPVVVVVHRSGDNLRVEFPFAVPTSAAAFRRSDMLWLVFDSAAKIDLATLTADNRDLIRSAAIERGTDGESIVRIRLERPRLTSLDTDGPGWIVNLGDTVVVPTRPLSIARSIVGKNRASIAIPFDDARKVHTLNDPDIGDRLMVITGLGPASGFLKSQDFVELRALSSAHGVVLEPIADDITAELASGKVTISRPGGLSLSATALGQQQLATSFRIMTFDTQLWGFDRQAKFSDRQSELIRIASDSPISRRKQARFNLARFYLARDMAVEAKAVLDVALADQRGNEDVTGSVLRAVANVLLSRPEEALKDLSYPAVGNQLDAPIWRAIAYARQGKWPEAREAFKNVETAMGALPLELQRTAMQETLRSALEVHDFSDAKRVVNEFETLGVPPELEPTLTVLVGRLYEGLGRAEDALTRYRAAATSRDRRAAAQGRLREIVLSFAVGDMPRKDVIHELETLTTVWRGDETEVEGLKLLAHLYTEDGRYRDAFHVMRTAMLAHPNSDLTRKIQDEAATTFDSLFLAGRGDALPPIVALGLFYDFRELTPIGRRGDEMIRRLADRLVSVDLLDQATELLQHQVDHRLQGAARAQVATRLAIIYLMNHKPERALAALQSTRSAELSNETRNQRLLLEARAMSDLKRYDLALEVIGDIQGREAIRLRSDILWAAHRWRDTAEQIELLYGERWRDFAPLSDVERSDILRAAIGFALGEETIGLERLREKYAAKMSDGPDRRAFDVVSAPVGAGGKEFQDIARRVASVDTLDTFLRDMRVRYPEPTTLPGAEKNAAQPAVPAVPEKSNGPAVKTDTPDKGAVNAPVKPAAANSPLPPKVPVGVPLKPEQPTGSIQPR